MRDSKVTLNTQSHVVGRTMRTKIYFQTITTGNRVRHDWKYSKLVEYRYWLQRHHSILLCHTLSFVPWIIHKIYETVIQIIKIYIDFLFMLNCLGFIPNFEPEPFFLIPRNCGLFHDGYITIITMNKAQTENSSQEPHNNIFYCFRIWLLNLTLFSLEEMPQGSV